MIKHVKLVVLVFLLILPLQSRAEFPASCPRMTTPNDCGFYTECLETQNQCGPSGYPLGYGLKYCNKFNEMNLSAAGEQWITTTMACLQNALINEAENKTDCGEVEEKGFDSHVLCYVSSGFCELPVKDAITISKATVWGIVSSLSGITQAADTLLECEKKAKDQEGN